jgi:hypothetical protein
MDRKYSLSVDTNAANLQSETLNGCVMDAVAIAVPPSRTIMVFQPQPKSGSEVKIMNLLQVHTVARRERTWL